MFPVDSGLATLVAAATAAFLTLNTFFFSWLRGTFTELRENIHAHEELSQKRHEDNLRRFAKISVALAKLGVSNGIH